MEKYENYRKDLAEDLKTIHKQDPKKAQEVLEQEKGKREYVAAKAWQDTEGRPARQEEIKTEKAQAGHEKEEQNEIEEINFRINKLKELGIEKFVNNGDFSRVVILKGKEFIASIGGVGSMYDGNAIGEGFTDKLEEFLKKLKFKDYGFVLKLIETSFDEDRDRGKTSFEITPIRNFSKKQDFLNASDLVMKEKLIKFSRDTVGYSGRQGSECKFSIEIPGGNTFIIDEYGDKEEQERVMAEIEKEYEKVMM